MTRWLDRHDATVEVLGESINTASFCNKSPSNTDLEKDEQGVDRWYYGLGCCGFGYCQWIYLFYIYIYIFFFFSSFFSPPFLPSTSLWGVYSETFIHRYNIPLTHALTRLCMICFPDMYILHYVSSPWLQCTQFPFFKLFTIIIKHFGA